MMELREIGERLGLDHRTLRYVAEQGIVPGLQVNKGRGNRRKLNTRQARLIGLAACLYASGLRGKLLRDALKYGSRAFHKGDSEYSMASGPECCVRINISLEHITRTIS